jgi:hypothetical protein
MPEQCICHCLECPSSLLAPVLKHLNTQLSDHLQSR